MACDPEETLREQRKRLACNLPLLPLASLGHHSILTVSACVQFN